jgi:serine/threonine-protein kinase
LARVCGLISLAFVLPSFGLALGADGFAKALARHAPQVVVPALLLAIARITHALGGSRRAIDACDAATALVSCVGFSAVLVPGRAASSHSELVVLLVATHVLVGRSIAVPSTWQRTLAVGVLALGPLLPLTYAAFAESRPDLASRTTLDVAEWSAVALLTSTLVSRRIFGLARRVEEARRLGQYTLEDKLGEGGMGEVYRARHALLRRPTAVKLLPSSRADEKDVARFEREVQLTSQLTHPSTIQIYDFGRAEDGTFYYAMEYIDGLTLEDLVVSYGAQPPGRVAQVLASVCASLAEAHDAGLVHRDIKPQNVMLCARGGTFDVVKVLDFGLVRSIDASAAASAARGESVAGTPAYMAPEAITSPASVDARSDVYAVGALAYYLLTGAPVFGGGSVFAVLARHVHEPPEPPSRAVARGVPAALEELVMSCLAKSPADRPANAHVLRAALLAVAEAEPAFDATAFWSSHASRRSAESVAPRAQAEPRRLQATRELMPS